MTKQKKLIIFDLDGTIADTFMLTIEAFNVVLLKYGIDKINLSEVAQLRDYPMKDIIKKKKVSFWKMFFLIRDARKVFSAKFDEIELFPEMPSIVSELKKRNYQLALLTSNSQENAERILEKYELKEKFDFICGNCGLFSKSRMMRKIMGKAHCEAENTYGVGDEVRDVEAGKKCGIKTIAVSFGFNSKKILKKYLPDYLADCPRELLKIF